jgi:hypothetical protein
LKKEGFGVCGYGRNGVRRERIRRGEGGVLLMCWKGMRNKGLALVL